jgi:formylglycine-generating enzyme required for sulfatase activity
MLINLAIISFVRCKFNSLQGCRSTSFSKLFTCLLVFFFTWSTVSAQSSQPAKIISVKDKSEMILIPNGPFVSGVNQNDLKTTIEKYHLRWEKVFLFEFPEEQKTIGDYYIDRYEITNGQYDIFMRETKHRLPKYRDWPQFREKDQPVIGVGIDDANAYCEWAGKRLPKELEWEKAARGTDGRFWPWGNTPDVSKFNGKDQSNFGPVRVGSFHSGDSPYGVSDMAGNVWEMTKDPEPGGARTNIRGGSYLNEVAFVRTTVRWASKDEASGEKWIGFRCVMEPSKLKNFAQEIVPDRGK